MSEQHKNAAIHMSLANLISIILILIFLLAFCQSKSFAGLAKLVIGEKDAKSYDQLENLIKYIDTFIDNIKKAPKTYPINLDGTKYAIVVNNCKVDEERCIKDAPKTQLCLRRLDIANIEDYCSNNRLDFAFGSDTDSVIYAIKSKNIQIKWVDNRVALVFI